MKLAPCPDCGNPCSLTATTCPRCGRIMSVGDLSETNLIESKQNSNSLLYFFLIHGLAVIVGVITSFVMMFIGTAGIVEFGLVLGLITFICFLIIGTMFGFVWDKSGWKLGLSLSSLTIILLVPVLLYDLISGKISPLGIRVTFVLIFSQLVGSCLGAFLGSEFKHKRRTD